MYNHQYTFDIELPKEAISKNRHEKIDLNLLGHKLIIGLIGYSKSGKDTVAKKFINEYGFTRLAFSDSLKSEMNKYLRESVYNFLKSITYDNQEADEDVAGGLKLPSGKVMTFDDIDFYTEDLEIKKRIRPFIIWYGEKMREVNGDFVWINKALDKIHNHDRIIITDIRRVKELQIFHESNSFIKKTQESFASGGCSRITPKLEVKKYSTLMLHVNQYSLTDSDALTHECLRVAQEQWMIDDTIYIDSRIPENKNIRKKALDHTLNKVIKNIGITKLDPNINYESQVNMF